MALAAVGLMGWLPRPGGAGTAISAAASPSASARTGGPTLLTSFTSSTRLAYRVTGKSKSTFVDVVYTENRASHKATKRSPITCAYRLPLAIASAQIRTPAPAVPDDSFRTPAGADHATPLATIGSFHPG
jgi:hypothetical protein